MGSISLILDNVAPISPAPTKPILSEGQFCPCDFVCDFEEKVFASDAGNGIQNDLTDFLFTKISVSDTIKIEIIRYGRKVAEVTDSTYGVYYNGFDSQPLYIGWVADWTLIFNAFSGGRYQIRVTSVILGVEEIFESRFFRLNTFDDEAANRTVKIQSIQSGNIESSALDYTGLLPEGWASSIRLNGTFGQFSPSLEADIYKDSSSRVIQNRDEVVSEYVLTCERVDEAVYKRFAQRDLIGNTLQVSDFNLLSKQPYEQFPVVVESFDSPTYNNDGTVTFSVVMRDRQQNVIKRNF